MRCFWEQIGVLGPIYRLLGRGMDDGDIAVRLQLTEEHVQGCISWLIQFLKLKDRRELALYATAGR